MSATFYSWVVPAFTSGSPVDHTWVTTYDNRVNPYPDDAAVVAAKRDYWYCWGSFHPTGSVPGNPTGFLASQSGQLTIARCLVTPNADPQKVPGARGTIFTYGVDGVCHQLANQVLYATKSSSRPPLTVRKARGYGASSFLYGVYGLQHAAWRNKLHNCAGVEPLTAIQQQGGNVVMTEPVDDFEVHAREVLASEPELLGKLLALRGEVQVFMAQNLPGFAPPEPATLNARNQHLLDQAAILLGPEKFEQVFGMPAGAKIDLVDPSIASQQR